MAIMVSLVFEELRESSNALYIFMEGKNLRRKYAFWTG